MNNIKENSGDNLNENFDSLIKCFETHLKNYVENLDCEKILKDAMAYSLLAGGKRIRPLLIFSSASLLGIDKEKVMMMATAIEMIHTYSLIHDDLPSMDNDDYRRGKLTNHKIFGEAIAILAGDALLNEAHTILIRNYTYDGAANEASLYMSEQAGSLGMINGQIIDMESENTKVSLERLQLMHKHKTGALIRAALVAPFILNNEPLDRINLVKELGEKLGLLFQVQDDVLDATSNFDTLGKSVGKDVNSSKSTYVTILGLEKSKEILNNLYKDIEEIIKQLGAEKSMLKEIIEMIYKREHWLRKDWMVWIKY